MRIRDWSSDVCSSDLVDPLYAPDRAGAGTLGSMRRMDGVLGVGAATESRIRFPWRAARHDGSADRRRVAGDNRATLRRAVRGAQAAAEREIGRATGRERVCIEV